MKLAKSFRLGLAMSALLSALPLVPARAADTTLTSSSAPGTVLTSQPMALTSILSNVATARRITYVSTDVNGKKITVSGAVLTPRLSVQLMHPAGATKTVAWAHGTEGLADQCAPSRFPNLDADASYTTYATTVAGYLAQGWTVAASDYPGLGTPGQHPFLIGNSEGRSVIDSVRAARNLNGLLSNKWAVSGHSQGGQAALYASELAPSYGAGLDLRGTVAEAPASNLDVLAPMVPGTLANGYVVMTLFGLASVDPSVVPGQILTPLAMSKAGVLNSGCLNEILAAYAPLSASQLVNGGQLPSAIVAKLAAVGNPAQRPNGSAALIVQGDADELVPLPLTQLLLAEECAVNTRPVQLKTYAGADHSGVLPASANDVISYITARFAGQVAPTSCQ